MILKTPAPEIDPRAALDGVRLENTVLDGISSIASRTVFSYHLAEASA